MTEPAVSVICIFLNAAEFLIEAIDSVLRQEGPAFELLLVDDGSTDASTTIARDHAARFPEVVRYLEHPAHANRGMSASRNLGLAHSRGAFVAFIDADDVWRPGKLKAQHELLEREPRAGMVCGAVNYWRSWQGGEDEIVPTGPVADALSFPPDTTLRVYPFGRAAAPCPSDVMLRRGTAEAVGGFEAQFTGSLQLYEDQAFFAKVYLTAPVYFATAVWLDYRQHPESCVATVLGGGGHAAVRRYFLEWFRGWLAPRDLPGKAEVERAVRALQWRLDHPFAARVERRVRRMAAALRPAQRAG